MKWTDLVPQERQILIGELIDAMIYNDQALTEVQTLLDSFRQRQMVKSIVLPQSNTRPHYISVFSQ